MQLIGYNCRGRLRHPPSQERAEHSSVGPLGCCTKAHQSTSGQSGAHAGRCSHLCSKSHAYQTVPCRAHLHEYTQTHTTTHTHTHTHAHFSLLAHTHTTHSLICSFSVMHTRTHIDRGPSAATHVLPHAHLCAAGPPLAALVHRAQGNLGLVQQRRRACPSHVHLRPRLPCFVRRLRCRPSSTGSEAGLRLQA